MSILDILAKYPLAKCLDNIISIIEGVCVCGGGGGRRNHEVEPCLNVSHIPINMYIIHFIHYNNHYYIRHAKL